MGKVGNKKKKQSGNTDEKRVDMVGPDNIQVLRGELLGKQVALVLCGESHNEALDLTRAHAVIEAKMGWVKLSGYAGGGWDVASALKRKQGLTLGKAKDWAAEYVENMEEEETVFLVWIPEGTKGSAYIYDADAERSHEHALNDGVVFEWADLDSEMREFNEFRLSGENVDIEAHDSLVEKRKAERQREGIQLFDDWLGHHTRVGDTGDENAIEVHLLIEQCPPPSELELHRDVDADDVPPAIECIRRLDEDSEASSDEDEDPSAYGDCDYLDYLYRRCNTILPPGRLHCVDMRCLGHKDAAIQAKWDSLLTAEEVASGLTLANPETAELKVRGMLKVDDVEDAPRRILVKGDSGQYRDASGTPVSKFEEGDVIRDSENILRDAVEWSRVDPGKCDLEAWGEPKVEKKKEQPTLPSFEGFFGQPANLLYYDRHMKACYAPLIARMVKSQSSWASFMKALFFGGTVPEALASLDLSMEARACSWVRSPICLNESGDMIRRRDDDDDISFLYLPVSRYLKAIGSDPPRTWLSALHARLESSGERAAELATMARQWALDAIEHFAKDPKANDDQENGGEWFVAWLRAAHREIYDDIDRSDESELLRKQWMPSESQEGKKHRHQIGDIKIPSCQEAFAEILKQFDSKKPSTVRATVLSQIFIDVWMVKLVDYAAVLKIIEAVVQAKASKVVVACYFGSQHTRAIENFWRSQGFSHNGLSGKGLVGKPAFELEEVRKLELPSYLRDLQELFPVES